MLLAPVTTLAQGVDLILPTLADISSPVGSTVAPAVGVEVPSENDIETPDTVIGISILPMLVDICSPVGRAAAGATTEAKSNVEVTAVGSTCVKISIVTEPRAVSIRSGGADVVTLPSATIVAKAKVELIFIPVGERI